LIKSERSRFDEFAKLRKLRECTSFLPLMSFTRTCSPLTHYSTNLILHTRSRIALLVASRAVPSASKFHHQSTLTSPSPRLRVAARHQPWPTPLNMSWSNVLQSYARMKDPEKELPKGVMLNCNKSTYVALLSQLYIRRELKELIEVQVDHFRWVRESQVSFFGSPFARLSLFSRSFERFR